MIRRLRFHAFLCAALPALVLLGGCAHSQPLPAKPKFAKADMKYSNVFVEDFTIAPTGVTENVPKPHVDAARTACMGALVSSELFDLVKAPGQSDRKDGALIVRAELTDLRIVGGGARFWLGAMAGSSVMRFQVTLIDASSGAVIGRGAVGDNTNAWGGAWTMGGTDRSLPGVIGGRVAEFVAFGAKK